MEWWQKAKQDSPKQMRKGLASAALLFPWMTWKHCIECIFKGAQPSVNSLVARIKVLARKN
jgi:hypothetical protein